METFYLIIALVWSVLVIILFFKIWGMTNNVAQILELLKKINNPEKEISDCHISAIEPDADNSPVQIGSIVYRCSDGAKMIVERSSADQYYCVDPMTHKYIDTYNRKAISTKEKM